MGGEEKALELSQKYHADKNLRFAATLLNTFDFAARDEPNQ
jgi:hypothetical protein